MLKGILPELWRRLLGRGKHRLAILCTGCGHPIEGEVFVFGSDAYCSGLCIPTCLRQGRMA